MHSRRRNPAAKPILPVSGGSDKPLPAGLGDAIAELDGLEELDTAEPEIFAAANRRPLECRDIRIVGGCCGTSPAHMQAIVDGPWPPEPFRGGANLQRRRILIYSAFRAAAAILGQRR